MDFIRVAYKEKQDGTREFYPSLQALESRDLVVRGGQFVAIWDEQTGLYSRKQSHVPEIIDRTFAAMVGERLRPGDVVKKMQVFDNQMFSKFLALIRSLGDMGPDLDQTLVFADEKPTKDMAATFVMPYSLSDGPHPAWDKIMETLYDEENQIKIMWMIGSIFTGAAAENIQKFYVFFGPPGSGKSTILNIVEELFVGHTAAFSAAELGRADSGFPLEPFKNNPLVAVDQDGDLSRIDTNTLLNKITAHDRVQINMKGKNLYDIIPRTTCLVGTNEPVKISNRKSGLFRRLVDIQPTGNHLPENEYHQLMEQMKYELGAIANSCIKVFKERGHTFLSSYRSTDMMYRTNDIFNFVQDNRLILAQGISLKQASKMYQEWCVETETRNAYKQYQFRDLLMDYFDEFHAEIMLDHQRHRSYFRGLKELEKFSWKGLTPEPTRSWLELDDQPSLLDEILKDMPAQYPNQAGNPRLYWDDSERLIDGEKKRPKPEQVATTKLSDLDTSKEHFVKVPKQFIVIDFDLTDESGNKSLAKNLEAAAKWPPTYAEVSRGGGGLHLHYDTAMDVERLADRGPDGSYEIKTLLGGASLRRRVSLCNNLPVATLTSGLPLKEEKVLSQKHMSSEKSMRELILRALNKDITFGTKPNMDFIEKVFKDAQDQGMIYDLSDMYDDILAFALGSTNQKQTCLEILQRLKLKSDEDVESVTEDRPHVWLDLEVYPNLFAIGWMYDRDDAPVVKLVNPTAAEVEEFLEKVRYSGYNVRLYDNHILYAATLGYDNQQLYELSQRIINNDRNALFGAAYNLHYSDLFEYMSEKETLKKWQIKYGLPHKEMDLPWDQPVPDDRVEDVLDYLENDVRSTREVAKKREGDFRARQIIADMTGMEVSNTNKQITERLVFGKLKWDEMPDLVYTDLREQFPGYEFDQYAPGKEKSTYRGVKVGEGGWVYSKPGMYENVVLLDVASMHPSSIIAMNTFGPDTAKFKQLMDIRLALKNEDFAKVVEIDPKLEKYITTDTGYDEDGAKALSDALKIVINSVYGLTAASFPNKFKDPRNIDNIVAKRGALFMVDVKEYVESLLPGEVVGEYEVVHIKTDSIKIVVKNPDHIPEIVELVIKFGAAYGYTFEHEATYEKFCLVNDAVYIAKYGWAQKAKKIGTWEAVGAQFQHPIVFKTLFSREEILPGDYVETKQVASGGAMYLVDTEDGYRQFVGRFGAFVPVLGGRQLLRVAGDKEGAVANTKGHLWELEDVAQEENMEVDLSYFQNLINAALIQLEKYGDAQRFIA